MPCKWKVFFVCILLLMIISINNYASDSDFFGYWENVDCNTRGITKFYLKRDDGPNTFRLHAYGSCHPTDCDWENTPLYLYGTEVKDKNYYHATAIYKTNFSITIITLEFMNDKKILLNSYTRFTDNSRRENYHSYDIFIRIDDGRNEPVSGCPDLVVERIHSTRRNKKDNSIIVKADIRNIGTIKSERCTAQITDRGNKDHTGRFFVADASVEPLDPEETVTVQFTIKYMKTKIKSTNSLSVKVDSKNEITECEEDNNVKQ